VVQLRVKEVLEALDDAGADFVLIGGVAAVLHGSAYVTKDIDIAFSRERENCQRLAAALARFQPKLRGAPPELPFQLDAAALRGGANFTLETTVGDLLGEVSGFASYRELKSAAEEQELYGRRTWVLSLDGLIRAKRAAGRPKDLLLLPELEALRALKEKGE
jgi:hypothetical protein